MVNLIIGGKMLEEDIKKEKSSWSSIKSNFVSDDDYLDEIGVDEELKKEIEDE